MLGEKLRPLIEPLTTGAGRTLTRAHLSPNALTTIGILLTIACAWLVAVRRPVAAGLLLIPAALVDVLDGAAARATGRVTNWGGFYDSVGDRIGDGAVLGAMAWAAVRSDDAALAAAALVALVLSFLVPYARAKAEALGYRVSSGPGERAERAIILILGLVFGLEEPALWLIAALTAITFAGRCASVWRQATREP